MLCPPHSSIDGGQGNLKEIAMIKKNADGSITVGEVVEVVKPEEPEKPKKESVKKK